MTSPAWYFGSRTDFIKEPADRIADRLSGRAAAESLEIEAAQSEEWVRSVDLLQKTLEERLPILRELLTSPDAEEIDHVILEYDFRRRGLRMDCLLLGKGVLFVLEFKRTKIQRADLDQVMTYAVNLLEFHSATQDLCSLKDGVIVVPIVALTEGHVDKELKWPGRGGRSWEAMASKPLMCDRTTIGAAIRLGIQARRSPMTIPAREWIESPFRPSSSILDATLSLYGNHDVVAIQDHATPKKEIDAATDEIRACALESLKKEEYHLVFLSGAPGAGKTLVGLELVMRGELANEGVFVTGNAPLVDVLSKALQKSFRSQGGTASSWAATGYKRADAPLVSSAAIFKIVKAHNFLGKRGQAHRQGDGRLLVFDEAQRTYEQGRRVLGDILSDHEADLILDVQKGAFPTGGSVIVALVGHNQLSIGESVGLLRGSKPPNGRGGRIRSQIKPWALQSLMGETSGRPTPYAGSYTTAISTSRCGTTAIKTSRSGQGQSLQTNRTPHGRSRRRWIARKIPCGSPGALPTLGNGQRNCGSETNGQALLHRGKHADLRPRGSL